MATRLFFHNRANTLPGIFPTTEQSASNTTTGAVIPTTANTLRYMDPFPGVAQSSLVATTLNSTTTQTIFFGYFCSRPLKGDQTVGGGFMTLNTADQENNAAANFWINTLNVYVWRPSTGIKVSGGSIRDSVAGSLGGTESTAGITVTHIAGIDTFAVSALDGDVIICEVWSRLTPGMNTAYTVTMYYDGSTVNTVENATVTNHASFVEFSEDLEFKNPKSFSIIV